MRDRTKSIGALVTVLLVLSMCISSHWLRDLRMDDGNLKQASTKNNTTPNLTDSPTNTTAENHPHNITIQNSAKNATNEHKSNHPHQHHHPHPHCSTLPTDFCSKYQGILRIEHGDDNAATGTVLFIYVVNHLIYASGQRLLPWIHLNDHNRCFDPIQHQANRTDNVTFSQGLAPMQYVVQHRRSPHSCYFRRQSRGVPGPVQLSVPRIYNTVLHENDTNKTIDAYTETTMGNGIWSDYFQSIREWECCQDKLPLLRLSLDDTKFALHYCAPWAVRPWPLDRMTKALFPRTLPNTNASLDEWYRPMRERASNIVSQYFHLQPWLKERIQQANPSTHCMAMHIRMTDKGHGRRKRPLESFRAFAEDYYYQCQRQVQTKESLDHTGANYTNVTLYVATDDELVMTTILQNWTKDMPGLSVLYQTSAGRSSSNRPVFDVFADNIHQVNTEALVEIYAMSRCQILVHGFSAMSEAAIYIHPTIVSINLDDEHQNKTVPVLQ